MKININVLSHLLKTPITDKDGFEKFLNERICEVDDREDDVFDVKILPDRASDTMSYYGLAREYGAHTNIPLQNVLCFLDHDREYNTGDIKITSDASLCECMIALSANVPQTYNSIPFIDAVLSAAGQKTISPLVDITNYMMFMYGNPIHVYDKDLLGDSMEIRLAKENESMETLHGEPVVFKGGEIVIANGKEIVSLAGVKGGKGAEIHDSTKQVVFEMGVFNNAKMRSTTSTLRISTEASKRFVHPLATELPKYIARTFVKLLTDAGFSDISINTYHEKIERDRIIKISWNKIGKLLGMGISKEHAMSALHAVGFTIEEIDYDTAIITPPWFRTDVDCYEVIADEIGRYYGYDMVKGSLCQFTNAIEIGNYYERIQLKKELAEAGFSEIITYSFVKKGDVEVAYPMAKDKGALRKDIMPLFSESIAKNKTHKDVCAIDVLSLFEIGTIFTNEGEYEHLCIGSESKAFLDVMVKKLEMGLIGCTFSKIYDKNLDGIFCVEYRIVYPVKSAMIELVKFPALVGRAKQWSLFPAMTRDISMWVPVGHDSEKVLSLIDSYSGDLLVRIPRMVDTFQKDGRVSVLVRLVFQSTERTLVSEEVDSIVNSIYDLLLKEGIETR